MKKNKSIILMIVLTVSLLVFTIFSFININKQPTIVTELTYNQFMEKVEAKQIQSIENYEKDSKYITGILTDGTKFKTDKPQDDLGEQLMKSGVVVKSTSTPNPIWNLIGSFLNLFLTFMFIYFLDVFVSKKMIRTQTRSMDGNFSVVEKCDITFDDVAGNAEAKDDLMELGEFLKNPAKYQRLGADIPRGTLLAGSPGNGKTMMAKALAGTIGRPFIATSGSAFVQQYVGVGAARVRELFEVANKYAPCVIFIDEIDALGRKRSGGGHGAADERDQTLNQLLVELDGFAANKGIIVLAATNRPELLDPALLRPGRFDRQINIELPDVDARAEILKIHSRNKPLADDVDMRKVAELTIFMSGADLKNVMNEAAIYAVRSAHKCIQMSDIDRAINKVIAGEERKNRKNITKRDKEITAYHEAGHALMAKLVNPNSKIPKVTIIPTTKGAGGYTLLPPEEKMYMTKKDMLNDIAVSLAGRAAEEIIFGKELITGGASSDIYHVTATVERMVKDFGMSDDIGMISLHELYKDSIVGSTSERIEAAIKKIIDEVYDRTKRELQANKHLLFNITKALLQKETIYQEDMDAIMAGLDPFKNSSEKTAVPMSGIIDGEEEAV